MPTQRTATVISNADLNTIRRYLPTNYTADHLPNTNTTILITGEDVAGWTLDGYVIPRLASGGIHARETTTDTA